MYDFLENKFTIKRYFVRYTSVHTFRGMQVDDIFSYSMYIFVHLRDSIFLVYFFWQR